MVCYISSNQNRFYAAKETAFGQVAGVTAAERFSAVALKAEQRTEVPRRKDKTGSRTDQGVVGTLRRKTQFELTTYLYGRASGAEAPRYGALVEAALGAAPVVASGGRTVSAVSGNVVTFAAAHGLSVGQGFAVGGELRFVAAVVSATQVVASAPLGGPGVSGGTVTYGLSETLPTVSVYDYWTPATAVQRILRGSAVDEFRVSVNGDFHELVFAGGAADIVDSKSFVAGQGGLAAFPAEPAVSALGDFPVPGHLGQVWIGAGPSRLYTLSAAQIKVKNHVDFRTRDFGALTPRCLAPGEREVTVDLEMYSQDSAVFAEIYQAARERQVLPLMVQLGETAGALCGVYLPSFIPNVPKFVDEETRLRWRLTGSVALGTTEDEAYVAFG